MDRESITQLINQSISSVNRILIENRDQGLDHAVELKFRRLNLTKARDAHLKGDDTSRDSFLRQALTGMSANMFVSSVETQGERHES